MASYTLWWNERDKVGGGTVKKRRGTFFRRQSKFSANPKRPVSTRTKLTYGVSLFGILLFVAALLYSVYTDGDAGRWFAGAGFLAMVFGFLMSSSSIAQAKKEVEPLPARILAVFLSLVVFVIWAFLYIMGMMRA